jgi:plasmid stability protein
MAVSLSVKDVPDVLAVALRERAKQHHRSLQGELLDILETAVRPQPFQGLAVWKQAQALGLKGRRGESARMVRQDRGRR